MSDLRAGLRNLSPEQLRQLRQRVDRTPAAPERRLPVLVPRPEERHEPFPLTDVQESLWVGRRDLYALGNVSTHGYWEWPVLTVDLPRLERALDRLIARHEMLRAIVLPEGQQRILAAVPPYEVEVFDLRSLDEGAAQERLDRLRAELSHEVTREDRWPLFGVRASLLPQGNAIIHLSFDFLVLDLWSFRLLMVELRQLYDDPSLTLPPLEVSFRDYVLALKEFERSTAFEKSERYWQERLATLPAGPELPVRFGAEVLAQPRFERRSARLDRTAWRRIKELGARQGLTASGLLLTAYALVLGRFSRSPRLTINVTYFNRLPIHPQIARVVGDFASLSLLSVDLAPRSSFTERARGVQRQLWQNLEHGQISAVRLMRELARRDGKAPTALMPVVFTSLLIERDEQVDEAPAGAVAARAETDEGGFSGISQTPQIWLDNQVVEEGGGLFFNWDAVEDLFPPGLLDTMFGAYCRLLEALGDEHRWAESSFDWLIADQLAVREQVNRTAAAVPPFSLSELFLAAAEAHPARPAILGLGVEISYQELERRTARLAARLIALGAQPDRRVAIVMEKGWEQVVAVLAVLRAGAAYLPIDPEWPDERRQRLLGHAHPVAILTQPWLRPHLAGPFGIPLETVPEEEPTADPLRGSVPVSPQNLAYVLYTSGTTGEPKGVMVEQRGVVNRLVDLIGRFELEPNDRTLALSALHHDLSVTDLFAPLCSGGAVVVLSPQGRRDPAAWSELVQRFAVTVWNSVPAFLEMWVEYLEPVGRAAEIGSSVRWVLTGGDWIPVTLPTRLRELLPAARVVSEGGPTETSVLDIWFEVEEVDPAWSSIPYGRPMANARYQVLNPAFEPCPDWVPGQLCVTGIGVSRGYLADPARTALAYRPDPSTGERLYCTGDLGCYHPDGTLEFLGRVDTQVKIRGQRIELGEIERNLERYEEVHAAVVRVLQSGSSQQLAAYVIRTSPSAPLAAEREALRHKLGEPGLRHELEVRADLELARSKRAGDPLLPYLRRASQREFPTQPPARDAVEGLVRQLAVELERAFAGLGIVGPTPELYVSTGPRGVSGLAAGVFRWHPELGRLELSPAARPLPREAHVVVNQGIFESAAFALLLLARGRLVELDRRSCLVAIGAACQALLEKAGDLGLGLCPVGSLDAELVGPALGLEDPAEVLHSFLGGTLEPSLPPAEAPSSPPLAALDRLGAWLESASAAVDARWPVPKYRYPSAGGLYPVQLHLVCLDPGRETTAAAYYHPRRHRLIPLGSSTTGRVEETHPPRLEVVLVGQLRAIEPKYGALARDFLWLEAGYLHGLLAQAAAETGLALGSPEIGSARDRAALELDAGHLELVRFELLGAAAWPALAPPARAPRPEASSVRHLDEASTERLRAALRSQLPSHMVPTLWLELDALPLTANGKVARDRLPDPPPRIAGGAAREERMELEAQIAGLVAEVLGLDEVALEESFFELGASSIQLVQIYRQLQLRLGCEIPVADLFDHPSVRALSARLVRSSPALAARPAGDREAQRRAGQDRLRERLERRSTARSSEP